jgi:hypothetical protein
MTAPSKYTKLLKKFDGTLKTVPIEIREEVMDHFAEAGNIQAMEGSHDIPAEIVRVVLEQPDLMQQALQRRAGEFTLQFVNGVLPAAIAKAASGETGSIQAAKLVAQVIGAVEGRSSTGRPKSTGEEEREPGLEEKLTALTQTTPKPQAKKKAPARLNPRKGNRGTA